jgi:hypothetical protein
MAQVYFHCSNQVGISVDRCGSSVTDLTEAREHAALVVRSLVATATLEDWRAWVIHVTDDRGEEIFSLPFTSLIGEPH